MSTIPIDVEVGSQHRKRRKQNSRTKRNNHFQNEMLMFHDTSLEAMSHLAMTLQFINKAEKKTRAMIERWNEIVLANGNIAQAVLNDFIVEQHANNSSGLLRWDYWHKMLLFFWNCLQYGCEIACWSLSKSQAFIWSIQCGCLFFDLFFLFLKWMNLGQWFRNVK